MELKYYLRGLGIGIAVTAIIMGIALSGDKPMTDEQIIARAKELGMVENTVLSDTENKETDDDGAGNEDTADETAPDDGVGNEDAADEDTPDADVGNEDAADEDTPDADAGNEDAAAAGTADSNTVQSDAGVEQAQDTGANGSVPESDAAADDTADSNTASATLKAITIASGDGSYTVAKKLQDAGAISSAETFDNFLCEHGYDKKLRTGTFSIPADASDEQIARIVTGLE